MLEKPKVDGIVRWLACGMLLALPFSVAMVNFCGYLIIVLALFSENWRHSAGNLLRNRLVWVVISMLALVVIGVMDSTGPRYEALNVLNRYHKLLFIPLLMPFFQQASHRQMALRVFFVAIFINVLISWFDYFGLTHWGDPIYYSVPFHPGDAVFRQHITQGMLFDLLFAISGVFAILSQSWKRGFFVLVGILTGLNILIVMVGRTGKALLPIILLWLLIEWWRTSGEFRHKKSLKRVMAIVIAMLVVSGTLWSMFNPATMLGTVIQEVKVSRSTGADTSQGERVEFWKKGLTLIRKNPWYGSGSGSIYQQTEQLAQYEKSKVAHMATYNLHNEFLMWFVQFGWPGAFVIIAFYYLYFSIVRGISMNSLMLRTTGMVFILGSLFNSFLNDFTEGYSMVMLAGILVDL